MSFLAAALLRVLAHMAGKTVGGLCGEVLAAASACVTPCSPKGFLSQIEDQSGWHLEGATVHVLSSRDAALCSRCSMHSTAHISKRICGSSLRVCAN
jgi:hypothetical protein